MIEKDSSLVEVASESPCREGRPRGSNAPSGRSDGLVPKCDEQSCLRKQLWCWFSYRWKQLVVVFLKIVDMRLAAGTGAAYSL